MIGFVYILQSLIKDRYYIGSTNDVARRFTEHYWGKNKSTKYLRPLKLVFIQQFPTLIMARRIEQKIKKFKNKKILKQIIIDKKITAGL